MMTSGAAHIRPARDTDAKGVLDLLALQHDLEAAFDPAQFTVAELDGRLVACGRLKPIGPGAWEIASVVVHPSQRGRRLGERMVQEILAGARGGSVYALALAPGFFERQGFRTLPAVPAPLVGKATSVCAKSDFVPMEFRRP